MNKNTDKSKRYSQEFKESMIKRMLPPEKVSPSKLSLETGVSRTALRTWLNAAIGVNDTKSKFQVVVETYALNEAELSEYCRKNGLFIETIKEWKVLFEGAEATQHIPDLRQEQIKDKQTIKQLERELKRKEKALAETAALLVLSKKLEAIWGINEDVEL